MTERTLDQRRAEHALAKIRELSKQEYKNYVSYVKALPATILQNGLGQAMATLLSASKGRRADDHYQLYAHVEDWLLHEMPDSPYAGQDDLMQAITTNNEDAYVFAQAEALAYLDWLKKLARAHLKQPEQEED